jgi:hypothetical protein
MCVSKNKVINININGFGWFLNHFCTSFFDFFKVVLINGTFLNDAFDPPGMNIHCCVPAWVLGIPCHIQYLQIQFLFEFCVPYHWALSGVLHCHLCNILGKPPFHSSRLEYKEVHSSIHMKEPY